MVGVLSPFPLVFIFLQRGKQAAAVLMVLIFGVLWFLVGEKQALLFMAEYAVMALVLGLDKIFAVQMCQIIGY